MERALVVVGTSWGGLSALSQLLRRLPGSFSLPVAVVQHRGKEGTSVLRDLLQDCTTLPVHEVEDKDTMQGGTVYLAPPDYHLLVEEGYFALSVDPAVRFSRPSIDVTFSSAADVYGPRLVGVVLTGANDDGARGLRCIVDRGGLGIVQAPETAESPMMPRAALARVPEAEALPLEAIADRLAELAALPASVRRRGAAATPPVAAPRVEPR